MTREYRIGDVEPLPADADIDMARHVMRMRGHLARQARSARKSEARSRALLIIAGLAESRFRETDPVERAKTYLRHRGFRPVAQVGAHEWQVGRRAFASIVDLLAFAREKGWRE